MLIWKAYKNIVKKNNLDVSNLTRDLDYWRGVLFANTIIYFLPFSFIALIPGIYTCILVKSWVLGSIDVASLINMLVIALVPGLSIKTRKLMFIINIYLFGIVFLIFLGFNGPGLLYLEAACMFSIFIFLKKYAFKAAFLNTIICILIGTALYYKLLPWANNLQNALTAWIAVSSNLIFLNYLSAALLPGLFTGLQESLEKEKALKSQLFNQQESLRETLLNLEQKNSNLKEIAWTQSHKVRAPLSNIMGIIDLVKDKSLSQSDKDDLIQYLFISANQLDNVIREISHKVNKTID